METSDDMELLQAYAREKSDAAFAALVTRHVDMVHSAAVRQTRDPHLAQEVAQKVFILLARKAGHLNRRVILSGWLFRTTRFVAAEVLRSENRRRIREQKAMDTTEDHAGESPSPWTEIEPWLDEAMDRLNENDRSVLLLRYFEKRSLKELGDALGIKEDAAQKRVARSLDKLRLMFAERGASVSAAGLGATLSTLAVQAAPAGLLPSILAAISAPAAGLTLTTLTFETLKFMTATQMKTALATAVLVTLVLAPPAVLQWQRSMRLGQANETLHAEKRQLQAALTSEVESAKADRDRIAQLQRDAADIPGLRAEIGALRQSGPGTRAAGSNPANRAEPGNPSSRMKRGRELQDEGKFAEALSEYLWCFDEGARDPAFVGVRVSFLLADIVKLAEVYPPAREALISRRDATEAAVVAGTASSSAVFELAALNKNLGEEARNVALYDQLPAGDPRRSNLMKASTDQFLAARRYKDIIEGADLEGSFLQRLVSLTSASRNSPQLRAVHEQMVKKSGSEGVEALAGAGETERAKAMADKLLMIHRTPEVLEQLIQHAERSGNAEVVHYLKTHTSQ